MLFFFFWSANGSGETANRGETFTAGSQNEEEIYDSAPPGLVEDTARPASQRDEERVSLELPGSWRGEGGAG